MNFTGEYQLSAPREEVWQALNSIQVLEHAIPGCRKFVATGKNQYQADIHTKLGPLTAKFVTRVVVENIIPLQSYTLIVESSGGAQGIGQGVANISLADASDETILEYVVEFKVKGKLAQVGSRLIGNAIKKLSNEFFDRLTSNFDASGVKA